MSTRGRGGKPKTNLVREINKIKGQLSSMKNDVEIKALDTASAVNLSTSGTAVELLNMTQGTTDKTRIGDEIDVVSIDTRIEMNINGTTGDWTNCGRILLVEDKAAGGSTPAATALLATCMAPLALNLKDRYIVHFDKMLSVSLNGPAAINFHKVVKFKKPRKVEYATNTGTAGDLLVRNFFLLMMTDSLPASTFHPTINYWVRVNYNDS